MFTTYKLNEDGLTAMKNFKSGMVPAVEEGLSLMTEGREKDIFVAKIEEAMFFGAKAIAHKDGNYSDIIEY